MRRHLAAVGLAALFWAPGVSAQPADDTVNALRNEIEALKAGQAALQRQLEEIRAILLRAREGPLVETPSNLDLSLEGVPTRGADAARLVVVEFTDYQCPFCARHVRQTIPQLDAEYVKPGKVRYAVRDFPLEAVHRQALRAAEAAHCAGEQNEFWAMHERLFSNQRALAPDDLRAHAQALGLDLARFDACLQGGDQAARVRRDLSDGMAAGVRGTPTFFVGVQEPGSTKVRVLRVFRGAVPFTTFKTALDEALLPGRP